MNAATVHNNPTENYRSENQNPICGLFHLIRQHGSTPRQRVNFLFLKMERRTEITAGRSQIEVEANESKARAQLNSHKPRGCAKR